MLATILLMNTSYKLDLFLFVTSTVSCERNMPASFKKESGMGFKHFTEMAVTLDFVKRTISFSKLIFSECMINPFELPKPKKLLLSTTATEDILKTSCHEI